jgi:hypothetical protein
VLSLVTFFARAKKVTQGAGAEPPAISLLKEKAAKGGF